MLNENNWIYFRKLIELSNDEDKKQMIRTLTNNKKPEIVCICCGQFIMEKKK